MLVSYLMFSDGISPLPDDNTLEGIRFKGRRIRDLDLRAFRAKAQKDLGSFPGAFKATSRSCFKRNIDRLGFLPWPGLRNCVDRKGDQAFEDGRGSVCSR